MIQCGPPTQAATHPTARALAIGTPNRNVESVGAELETGIRLIFAVAASWWHAWPLDGRDGEDLTMRKEHGQR